MEIAAVGKYEEDDAQLGLIFSALADPTRRRLVSLLRDGESTVNELAARFDLGVPAISKHLTVLEHAGVISRHRDAQWRRCRLEARAFDRLRAWNDHYTELWRDGLERLDELISQPDPELQPDPEQQDGPAKPAQS